MNTRNQMTQFPMFNKFRDTWTPFSEFFDDLMPLTTGLITDQHFVPACEVEEGDDHYLFVLETPGVKKENLKIEFADNQLVICGERTSTDNRNTRGVHYSERGTGKFQRSFRLPVGVDAEKAEANYQDGVLRILVPKAESAKPRQIKITNGSGTSKFFSKLLGSKGEEELHSSSNSEAEKMAS